jgi:DNA repair photolyase
MINQNNKNMKGRGAQNHINNRFDKRHLDLNSEYGIDENFEISSKTKFIASYAKTLVNAVPSDDIGVPYSANPFQGCEHGCSYCYARPTHEYWGYNAGIDFEQNILYKPNAVQLLKNHFEKKDYKPQPILLSGNTDCYQPAEKKFRITRAMVKTFLEYKHPLAIVTKNALILRDLDLLKDLASDNLVYIYISITGTDELLRRNLEPRTSHYSNRFRTLEELSKNNIPAGLLMAPIIPALNSDQIPEVLRLSSNCGAKTAGYTMLRLNGSVKEVFSNWLEKYYPDRKQKIMHQVASIHGGNVEDYRIGIRMRGEGEMADSLRQIFQLYKKKYFSSDYRFIHNLKSFRVPGESTQLNLFSE